MKVSLILFILFLALFRFNCAAVDSRSGFSLPKPSGSYAVGTRYFYFIDENRPDIHTSSPDDYREISVQVWYPAEPKPNQLPMNYDKKEAAEHIVNIGFVKPSFVDEVALGSRSHSYHNAAVAKEKNSYPVILFSASAAINGNSLLFEELASHGYVVFRLGHPHWCEYYLDADGKIFFRDKEHDEYNKKMWLEENSNIVHKTKDQLTRAKTAQEKLALQRKLNKIMPVEINDIRLWVGDIGFIIDELEKKNRSGKFFKGKLDLQKIGVMGYSKGGAAAGQACLSDKRCQAGINLSGFMFGDVGEKQMSVPFMVIEGVEPWCRNCLPINDALYHTSKSSIYMVQVNGATHASFTDVPAWKEYVSEKFKNILGSIDGRRVLKIQNDYVLQFFNKHLKGLQAPLLDGPAKQYPEVIFKSCHL